MACGVLVSGPSRVVADSGQDSPRGLPLPLEVNLAGDDPGNDEEIDQEMEGDQVEMVDGQVEMAGVDQVETVEVDRVEMVGDQEEKVGVDQEEMADDQVEMEGDQVEMVDDQEKMVGVDQVEMEGDGQEEMVGDDQEEMVGVDQVEMADGQVEMEGDQVEMEGDQEGSQVEMDDEVEEVGHHRIHQTDHPVDTDHDHDDTAVLDGQAYGDYLVCTSHLMGDWCQVPDLNHQVVDILHPHVLDHNHILVHAAAQSEVGHVMYQSDDDAVLNHETFDQMDMIQDDMADTAYTGAGRDTAHLDIDTGCHCVFH